MSPTSLFFPPITDYTDLAIVADLARQIWEEFYVPLIGRAQVDYMVSKFQSEAAMRQQIADGYEYFMIRAGAQCIGYIAVEAQTDRTLFLSKFYLVRSVRGTGMGRKAMEFVAGLARSRGLESVWLTVNKKNPAVHVYERLGFVNEAPVVMDIGGGFVMDDYRMRRTL